jgi:hypothetical protein
MEGYMGVQLGFAMVGILATLGACTQQSEVNELGMTVVRVGLPEEIHGRYSPAAGSAVLFSDLVLDVGANFRRVSAPDCESCALTSGMFRYEDVIDPEGHDGQKVAILKFYAAPFSSSNWAPIEAYRMTVGAITEQDEGLTPKDSTVLDLQRIDLSDGRRTSAEVRMQTPFIDRD